MAKEVCVFCGEVPGLFKESAVTVAGMPEFCCADCRKEAEGLSEEALCRRALQGGHAKYADRIQARLDLIVRSKQARPKCRYCGGDIKFDLMVPFQAPYRSGVMNFTFDVVPGHCTKCYRFDFFSPDMLQEDECIAYLYESDTN